MAQSLGVIRISQIPNRTHHSQAATSFSHFPGNPLSTDEMFGGNGITSKERCSRGEKNRNAKAALPS
jgi:hypothetical protein